ncbi:hypothetical protein FALCPG4_015634 [Fusarium falciforme]
MPLVAVHTRFWNVAQTIPRQSVHDTAPNTPNVRLKNCSFTAESALNGHCVLHSGACDKSCSGPERHLLPRGHASLNKIRNTRKRRNTTTKPTGTQSSVDYAFSTIDSTDSESEDDNLLSNCDNTNSRGSKLEVLENFGTTDNEREALMDYFNTREAGSASEDDSLRLEGARNGDSAEDENLKFEQWMYKSFNQLFYVASAFGE